MSRNTQPTPREIVLTMMQANQERNQHIERALRGGTQPVPDATFYSELEKAGQLVKTIESLQAALQGGSEDLDASSEEE